MCDFLMFINNVLVDKKLTNAMPKNRYYWALWKKLLKISILAN